MAQRNITSALALALFAVNAAAVSIGNAQGSVTLGRPLDVSFPVTTDRQSIVDACVRGVVSANGSPLSQAQVKITPVPGAAGRSAAVRVQTSQVVSEPVIAVQLTIGCDGSVVRNFNLLAYPAETLAAQQPSVPEAAPSSSSDTLRSAGGTRVVPSPVDSSSTRRSRPAKKAPARADAPSRSKAVPAVKTESMRRSALLSTAPVPDSASNRARLVMEPLSDWLDAPSVLKVSPVIETAPSADAPAPAERAAAAAMWRVLNMPPEERLQQQSRVDDQLVHVAQVEREKAAAIESQQALQEQLASRFSSTVVYLLVALLLLLAALSAWLWSRARRHARLEELAWAQSVAKNATPDVGNAEPVSPRGFGHSPNPLTANARSAADSNARLQPTEPELLPSGMMPLEFGMHKEAELAPANGPFAAVPTKSAPAHAVVNPEALFDLQQQAEFFVSVGEHGQAIAVLKQHIQENQATSPLAYLELLRLYRSLSRIEDFNNLRAQMHLYFNVQVPEFAAFARLGKNLFGYPDVLARIEALWADSSVVALLQDLLFRDSSDEHQRFELPAYDDLLLLHAVAGTTAPSERGSSEGRSRTTPVDAFFAQAAPQDSVSTTLSPENNLMDFEPDWEFEVPAQHRSPEVEAPASLTLDLDLSDLGHLDALAPAVPPAGQPIGFGANNDRFEARLDPDLRKPD